jgi:hypothetical protein
MREAADEQEPSKTGGAGESDTISLQRSTAQLPNNNDIFHSLENTPQPQYEDEEVMAFRDDTSSTTATGAPMESNQPKKSSHSILSGVSQVSSLKTPDPIMQVLQLQKEGSSTSKRPPETSTVPVSSESDPHFSPQPPAKLNVVKKSSVLRANVPGATTNSLLASGGGGGITQSSFNKSKGTYSSVKKESIVLAAGCSDSLINMQKKQKASKIIKSQISGLSGGSAAGANTDDRKD